MYLEIKKNMGIDIAIHMCIYDRYRYRSRYRYIDFDIDVDIELIYM